MIVLDDGDLQDFEFGFGKYRYFSYQYVKNTDPSYIIWLIEEGRFVVPDAELLELDDACNR